MIASVVIYPTCYPIATYKWSFSTRPAHPPARPDPLLPSPTKLYLQYKYSGGTYGADFEPFDDCPGIVDDSPTPAPTLTPGAVYLGCFKDKKNYRTMETLAYKAKNQLTNEVKNFPGVPLLHL